MIPEAVWRLRVSWAPTFTETTRRRGKISWRPSVAETEKQFRDKLKRLRELEKAATPGPWVSYWDTRRERREINAPALRDALGE